MVSSAWNGVTLDEFNRGVDRFLWNHDTIRVREGRWTTREILVLGDDTFTIETAYTALTRGRDRNQLYLAQPDLGDEHHGHTVSIDLIDAYHNGTAWTWTFPVFCEALAAAWNFDPAAVTAAKHYLASMERLLDEGCLGQLPEIVDGDAPHTQRGCDAQAWGATEALRVWKLLQR